MKTNLLLLCALLIPGAVFAQDDFEKFKKQQENEFSAFKDARDKAFSNLLKEAWQFVNMQEPVKAYSKPKVEEAPIAPPEPPKQAKTNLIKAAGEESVPKPRPIEPPPAPTVLPPAPQKEVSASVPTIKIAPYGLVSAIPFDPAWKGFSLKARNQQAIADFFGELARSKYEKTVESILSQRTALSMNDWALGVTVEQFSKEIFSKPDEQILLTWFLLSKAGYAARIGFNEGGISLLIPSDIRIFGAKYFTLENVRFYVMRFTETAPDPGAIYTYEGKYPDASRRFDFTLDKLPSFSSDEGSRDVTFAWASANHTVSLKYNKQAIAFMKKYPQIDLPVYFRAQVSPAAGEAFVSALKPLVEGKSEWDAVNLIMRFVQTAFAYKTDEDQFGYEKYFFVEETVFYPFSDCEDRSILFAYLVKTLLGNEVVGLKFPGHLATAVAFRKVPTGDAIDIGGKTFTVCDPTYINATAGMTMPDFKDVAPTVVRISN